MSNSGENKDIDRRMANEQHRKHCPILCVLPRMSEPRNQEPENKCCIENERYPHSVWPVLGGNHEEVSDECGDEYYSD
jgi:hypothetical protein